MTVRERVAGRAVLAAFQAGTAIASNLPPSWGLRGAAALGRAAARFTPDRRVMVERNLTRALGPLPAPELRRLTDATFESYARYYFDSFRLTSLSRDAVEAGISVTGWEHVEEALAHDPVAPVLALPHLGGWEWAAFWVTMVKGHRLAAVAEELSPPELFEWFLSFRRAIGLNIIPLGPDAANQVVESLASGEIVCLLCDRDLHGGGVPVTFLGEDTTLPAGPAVMALKGGARVLPTAVYFDGDRLRGVVRPPVTIERTPGATSIRPDVPRFMQALAHELEALIREAPEQWHLMQPNWPSDYAALGLEPPSGSQPA